MRDALAEILGLEAGAHLLVGEPDRFAKPAEQRLPHLPLHHAHRARRTGRQRWGGAGASGGMLAPLPPAAPARRSISAPAQKPRRAPVRMMTRTAASRAAASIAWRKPVPISALKALSRSGRFSVTVAMRPLTS